MSTYPVLSDAQLVEACLAGDAQAWIELVKRYSPLVYARAHRFGLGDDDASDIFQEVFQVVHQRLSSLRNRQALAAWLLTITQRLVWQRVQDSPSTVELSEDLGSDPVEPDGEVQRLELQGAFDHALRVIDPRCGELLKLLFLSEDTPQYKEIAARLGVPVGSIGPMRTRCFKQLAKIMAQLGY